MSKQLIESIPELHGLNYLQIAQWFNFQPLVENHEPQKEVPVKMTIPRLLRLTSAKRVMELTAIPMYSMAKEAYLAGNLEDALAYLGVLHESGTITSKEHGDIIKELQKTEPDPDYQKEIPGPARYVSYDLVGPISAEMVQDWLQS